MYDDIQELRHRIHELRDCLHQLIENKNSLMDPEVMGVSRMLDMLLNEYEKMILDKDRFDNLPGNND